MKILNRLKYLIKPVINWITFKLTLYHTMMTFNAVKEKAFENIVGKEENAGNQHLLFSQCFLFHERQL